MSPAIKLKGAYSSALSNSCLIATSGLSGLDKNRLISSPREGGLLGPTPRARTLVKVAKRRFLLTPSQVPLCSRSRPAIILGSSGNAAKGRGGREKTSPQWPLRISGCLGCSQKQVSTYKGQFCCDRF